ncbi:thermonuclease family protein [Nitratireductor basaltis]|nr:thermonuclease family protein [Nitratireductor basaltis]
MADIVVTILILGGVTLVAARFDRLAMSELAGIPRVADGDSLVLGGERLRLKGVDAPEIGQGCEMGGQTYDCGRKARQALQKLVGSAALACKGWERDRYDRLLVRCTADGRDINAQLVEAGWAVAYGDYEREERRARAERRGIWAGEFDEPSEWRRMKASRPEPRHGTMTSGLYVLRRLFGAGGNEH